jgi:hypothetical protein
VAMQAQVRPDAEDKASSLFRCGLTPVFSCRGLYKLGLEEPGRSIPDAWVQPDAGRPCLLQHLVR